MKKRLFALLIAMLMLVSVFAFASCGDPCADGHVDADGDEKCDNCQADVPKKDEGGDGEGGNTAGNPEDEEPEREPTYKIEFVYSGTVYENAIDPETEYIIMDETGRPKRVATESEILLYTLDIIQNTAPTAEQVTEITDKVFTYGGITIIDWYDSPEKTNKCDLDALLASVATKDIKLYAELRTEVPDKKDRMYAGDDVTWEIQEYGGKTVLVLDGKGPMYDFTYPELAPWYFDEEGNRINITNIDFEGEITSIGSYSFYNVSIADPKNIDISESVETIGAHAFAYSKLLKAPPLTENTVTIGRSAFEGCDAFTSIVIPDSVENIEGYAFYDCLKFKTIVLGTGIKNIGEFAFHCDKSNTNAHEYTYYRGTEEAFKNVIVGIGNDKFYSYGAYLYFWADAYEDDVKGVAGPYWVYDKDGEPKYLSYTIRYKSSATRFPLLTDYVLIGADGTAKYTAENIANYKAITYRGYKFESWGNTSYENGTNSFKKHMDFTGIRGSIIGDNATYHFNQINTLTIKGEGSTWDFEGAGDTVYSSMTSVAGSVTIVKFEPGITRLGSNVLAGLTKIVYIEIPSTVTEVDPKAFAACPNLAAIYYEGETLCKGLDSLVDTKAIAYAKGSSTSSGNGSFWAMSDSGDRLAWSYQDGVLSIGGDNLMPDFKLKDGVSDAPWTNYDKVTELTFAKNIVKIGENAFAGMKNLDKITLHDDLVTIPRSAFKDSAYWKAEANWDNGALMAGKHLLAFDASKMPEGVTYATVPQATKYIAADAFEGCGDIKELVLPAYIESIDPTSFAGLTSLVRIYYYGQNVNAWNTLKNIPESWNSIVLYRATAKPAENPENYWRMVSRVPTTWDK